MAEILKLEYFQPIPGWEGYYEISNVGRIVRIMPSSGARVGQTVKWSVLKSGYAKVSLCRDSGRVEFLVHRLVASAFIGEPGDLDVCHFDGRKLSNRRSNLRIDTRAANVADNVRLDRHNRGERCGSNKHSEAVIADLKKRMQAGERPCDLSRQTGIPSPTLYNIRRGAIWRWLNEAN